MPNKEPENKIMRAVGKVILYGAAISTFCALLTGVVLWLDSIRDDTNQNSESIDAIKEDLSYIRTDMADLKNDVSDLKEDVSDLKEDVSELKEDVSVLKEDVSELKEDVIILKDDVGSIKGKLNLPTQPASSS